MGTLVLAAGLRVLLVAFTVAVVWSIWVTFGVIVRTVRRG